MSYGPKPKSRCREVTILCRVNRHNHHSSFEVWERTGVSGDDAARVVLYKGDSFADAYAMGITYLTPLEENEYPR